MKYYLYVEGIPGDVQDGLYQGWFEVDSFDLDVLISGTASFRPLTVGLDLGTGLTSFLQKLNASPNISNVQLHQVSETGHLNVYSLQNVRINNVSNGSGPADSLTFDYTKIMMATGVRYPDGSVVKTGATTWDVAANMGSPSGTITTPTAAPSSAVIKPARYFLMVDGVDGGCREAGHVGWFEISAYDFEVANSGSAQMGLGATSFSALTVDLQLGIGLMNLLMNAASNRTFAGIKIDGIDAAGRSVLGLTLTGVRVAELDQGDGTDHIRFSYEKIGFVTKAQAADGSLTIAGSYGYNLTTATTITDVSTLSIGLMPAISVWLKPIAQADAYSVETGEVVTIAAAGVLANDSDPAFGTLTVTKVNGAEIGAGIAFEGTLGSLSLNADGSFSYTANRSGSPGSGTDSFTYEVKNTSGLLATATISFTVTNDGANVLSGSSGNDNTNGGQGNDTLHGSLGADTLDGGSGTDTISYSASGTAVTASLEAGSIGIGGDAEGDVLDGFEILIGSAFDDHLTGAESENTIDGGAGADTMSGGDGNDTYYVDNAGDRVTETATGGTADLVYASASYTLAAYVENLYATGSSAINLSGNTLANIIKGNAGANKINGGLGQDTLYGGPGKDIFVFNTKPSSSNVDMIADYNVADDSIQLENAVFTKLKAGKLANSVFWKGAKAHDQDDRIIYDPTKGSLYYDADGTGSSKQVLIATMSKNLKMTYTEFFVI